MADEEQFSLCWNNFNSNLSAGFHESLCRGDLVDVTLAAEGQLVKAHRLVLSVCSPYFRKMFTQMPANQHAFVFLKDVSHAALKDLIQFMYCGEVNVKQDALPTFISTAEALQIKGLTETGEPATPASSQTPVKVSTPAPSVASTTATTSPRSRVQRNISRTSYKLESEDSSDDKPAPVVAQKRLISRSITPVTAPALKRTKNSDPLEASEPTSQQQIITTIETKSNAEETEFIDLPMETMPTKSEPDYGDDTGEVEAVDQDTTYVEDDSGDYGDMKYDSSYFTENDDVKAGASGFAEPYAETGDQSANEAQDDDNDGLYLFVIGRKGGTHLVHNEFIYRSNMKRQGRNLNKMYWECIHNRSTKCRGRVKSVGNKLFVTNVEHNHDHDVERLDAAHKSGCLVYKSISSLIATKPSDKNDTLGQTVPPTGRAIEVSDLIVLNKCEAVL
ncbi:modifier of mdg4 isoform X5 [Bradysia coprophila]|uniref:modifier of mdg4 isoform X5 n=1 Tax=Bradysia coprophila TaxID=38358 RepID=UPI00187DD67B|nr:modifier of mdg4 isoform X5 [Bradysia coprophila]